MKYKIKLRIIFPRLKGICEKFYPATKIIKHDLVIDLFSFENKKIESDWHFMTWDKFSRALSGTALQDFHLFCVVHGYLSYFQSFVITKNNMFHLHYITLLLLWIRMFPRDAGTGWNYRCIHHFSSYCQIMPHSVSLI
jgi:hypothetical protein